MKNPLVVIFLLLTLTSVALAENSEHYFEYAPDPWQSNRLTVAAGQTPSQLFVVPENITLTGFDLWADNTGDAGSVTFTIFDNENTSLGEKIITLPELSPVPGGNKRHINLTAGIPLAANTPYRIQINASLPGFGLYYAKRVNFLEHNRDYLSDYTDGVARLGSEDQLFTFKFALYRQPENTTYTPPSEESASQEPPTTLTTTITNARVVSLTDTTAVFAWTTNIAADSRVTIRTQLNPLFVITSGFDPTLELEHTLTIPGLTPSINYFADVFSGQGNELLLTTYTIGFQTESAAAQNPTPPPPTQDPTPPPAPPPAPQPNQTNNNNQPPTNTSPSGSQNNSSTTGANNSGASGDSGLAPLNFGPGARSGNFSISWNAPAGGEPSGGYRIDIFDANHNLERQFTVPSGTHAQDIAQLTAGEHSAIVYANENGVYTKVGAPNAFSIKSQVNRRIWFSLVGGFLFLAGSAWFLFWWFGREKSPLPVLEE